MEGMANESEHGILTRPQDPCHGATTDPIGLFLSICRSPSW